MIEKIKMKPEGETIQPCCSASSIWGRLKIWAPPGLGGPFSVELLLWCYGLSLGLLIVWGFPQYMFYILGIANCLDSLLDVHHQTSAFQILLTRPWPCHIFISMCSELLVFECKPPWLHDPSILYHRMPPSMNSSLPNLECFWVLGWLNMVNQIP